MIDKLEFFKEATQRATSNPNPDKAIPEFYKYIQSIMPLDAMTHLAYDPQMGAVRIRSMRTDTLSLQPDQVISLSEEANRFYQWPFDKNVVLQNSLQEIPLGQQVLNYFTEHLGECIGSAILLRMIYEEQVVGITGFFAKGNERYTHEHAELIEMLSQILSIVTRNGMQYYDQLSQVMNLTDENQFLYKEFKRITGDKIIGADTGLKDIMHSIKQLSQVDTPVLIAGETGVGKELVANAIQQSSERANAPFVIVNCGAIPDSLMDSELFGYEKGAFTGADSSQKGRFERAHKGTIFLDEVGELPPAAQVRMLRVVQNKEIERVGGKSTTPLDIRIIAATHRDLPGMIKAGSFREDLYFRLNVFPVTVPPLRHRIEDIPALLDHFVKKLASRMKLRRVPNMIPGTLDPLLQHDWPGNIRELENLVERALILKPEGPLDFSILLNPPASPYPPEGDKKIKPLDEIVRHHILRALDYTDGVISGISGAAQLLGIHPNTMRNRMDKLDINYRRNKAKR